MAELDCLNSLTVLLWLPENLCESNSVKSENRTSVMLKKMFCKQLTEVTGKFKLSMAVL